MKKRILAAILSLTMVFSLCSASMITAAASETDTPTEGLVLQYDFTDVFSNLVTDNTGGGRGAELKNGAKIVDATINGNPTKAMKLTGGNFATSPYLALPQDIFSGLSSTTISCWVNVEKRSGYQRIWDMGNHDTSTYFYLLTDGGNAGATGFAAAITNGGWSKEQAIQKGTSLAQNKWILTTVVFDDVAKTMTLYEDGVQIGTRAITVGVNAIKKGSYCTVGQGQFNNDGFVGQIADFRVYDRALSSAEVNALVAMPDQERVNRDADLLTLSNTVDVTTNITLPTSGSAGSTIKWSSDNTAVSNTGVVTRPAPGEGDATVTLTATLTFGEATATKFFTVTVKQLPTAQQIAEHDAAAITLGNLSALTQGISLPATGEWGSAIVWTTSDKTVITNTGIIHRPVVGEEPVTATLTASITKDSATLTRDFSVTVLPSYYVQIIQEVAVLDITTEIGKSPLLPNMVEVTYTDGSKDTMKAIWNVNINKTLYAAEGMFEVSGKIIDTDIPVTANITVVADLADTLPEISAVPFDLSDVKIIDDSILSQNRDRDFEYLLLLDNNRMLYNFRSAFGQDTKGAQPLGGWDEPNGLLRGHSTGHYLSSLALAYASSGDEQFKVKLDEMISELRKLQNLTEGNAEDFVTTGTAQISWSKDPKTFGKGFLSAYSPDQFAQLEEFTPYATIWAPYYTLHKIFAGLLDAYEYAGNAEALEAAKDLGTWIYRRLSICTTAEQRTRMWAMYIAGEYGGMNEVMAKLYNITGDENYLTTAKMFDNTVFFDGLANNEDTIKGRHANQHIPQIVGAVSEYDASGEQKYYDIASNFWDMVTGRYAYSIGGVGTGEMFKTPYDLAANIDGSKNCETCASYNMLKLTKGLYSYNPDDAQYMDYYERTLNNHIVASQNQQTTSSMHNGTTYMLPIGPGTSKGYGGDYNSFTCCHGTGMENHVKYQEAAYFKSADNSTLYVNLYMPTELNWTEKGVIVRQDNAFPSDYSKFTVTGDAEFTMKLRVPYWATNGFKVKVNGEEVIASADPSTYVELNRTWSTGDTVEVEMPFGLHLDKTPDKLGGSTVASIMYGPLVMVAKNSSTDWLTLDIAPQMSDSFVVTRETGKPITMQSNGQTFVPMYTAYNFKYHTYFKVNTADAGEQPAAWYKASVEAVPANGEISLSKTTIPEGGSFVITLAPADGYKVGTLLINGVSVKPENNSYKVTGVTADQVVSVTFISNDDPDPTFTAITTPDIGDVSGVAGTEVSIPVSLANFPSNDVKALDAVITIPEGLEVVDVTANKTNITASNFEWNVSEGKLRLAFMNTNGTPVTFVDSDEAAELLSIKVKLTAEQLTGKTFDVAFSSARAVYSDSEAVSFEVGGAVSTITIVNEVKKTAEAKVLYQGDGVDLIPADMKAVSVIFTGVETTDLVKFGDATFYYSSERSDKTTQTIFVGLVKADISVDQLNNADNYTFAANGTSILFGDTDGSKVLDAQDALSIVSAWLRKENSTPDDKMMLVMNVSADERIDTNDAIAVVNAYIGTAEFPVISK